MADEPKYNDLDPRRMMWAGLLSDVGKVFHSCGVNLQNAKVATFGSQAEDVFYIASRDGGPLSEEQQGELREQLIKALDQDE